MFEDGQRPPISRSAIRRHRILLIEGFGVMVDQPGQPGQIISLQDNLFQAFLRPFHQAGTVIHIVAWIAAEPANDAWRDLEFSIEDGRVR